MTTIILTQVFIHLGIHCSKSQYVQIGVLNSVGVDGSGICKMLGAQHLRVSDITIPEQLSNIETGKKHGIASLFTLNIINSYVMFF